MWVCVSSMSSFKDHYWMQIPYLYVAERIDTFYGALTYKSSDKYYPEGRQLQYPRTPTYTWDDIKFYL